MDEKLSCPICEGSAFLLGVLGERAHYRCRYCGFDFSVERDLDERIDLLPVRPEEVA